MAGLSPRDGEVQKYETKNPALTLWRQGWVAVGDLTIFHRHDAFDRVSRAMRAPGAPARPIEIADMAELIAALDQLVAARTLTPCDDLGATGTV